MNMVLNMFAQKLTIVVVVLNGCLFSFYHHVENVIPKPQTKHTVMYSFLFKTLQSCVVVDKYIMNVVAAE